MASGSIARPDDRRATGVTLAGGIRIAVRLLSMLALLVACVPLYYTWRAALPSPNPWPRRFLAGIAAIAGARVRVEGDLPARGAFLLANHVSWLDIPVIAGTTGSAFVAHSGLAAHGLLKWLCDLNDTVFIARDDRRSVARQVEQVREALGDTGALTIFPEGTTGDGTTLLPFKSSLLSALEPPVPGVTIRPVLIDYGNEAASIAWTGDEPGLANFLRILGRKRPIEVTVHFLTPLDAAATQSRKTMAAAAQARLLAVMARG